MITEIQKLLFLRDIVSQKIFDDLNHANDEILPVRIRYFFKKDVEIERVILRDIKRRLKTLDCDL